jgi:membrane protein insertase Oxa1/YidC/SpoIIIJ
MILLTPLTLKSTKSMLELQRLQPEVRRPAAVQGRPPAAQRRDDGALQGAPHQPARRVPRRLQAPVFFILFRSCTP